MTKQNAQSNIVYDSFNDVTWDFSGFFETLADYYEGKPETMAEDLVQAVKTLMLIEKETIFNDAIKETSLNLLYLREAIKGIEYEVLEN